MTAKELRPGFTTGAAAAAATKAALLYLVDGKTVESVEIRCLNNEWIAIAIHSLKRLSDNCAEAIVIKDGGDDPDVTHNAEIGSRVSIYHSDEPTITIRGGEGVGMVTKPGLEVQPGSHAINPGPEKMVREAISTTLQQEGTCHTSNISCPTHIPNNIIHPIDTVPPVDKGHLLVDVEIFVPKGRELAEKTLNSRLGILGGISILGTTGIVRPMSHDAYIATIRSGISVARAMGIDTLVFTTGRRSERFGMALFPYLSEEAFIQTGDFFKASLAAASETEAAVSSDEEFSSDSCNGQIHCKSKIINKNREGSDTLKSEPVSIKKVIIVVFFGKAVKMAMGFPHTHAAKSELTMKTLAKWADEITGDCTLSRDGATLVKNSTTHDRERVLPIDDETTLASRIASANTARHAFTYIYPEFPLLISHVGNRIVESARRFSNHRLNVRAIILDFEGNRIFDSETTNQEDVKKLPIKKI